MTAGTCEDTVTLKLGMASREEPLNDVGDVCVYSNGGKWATGIPESPDVVPKPGKTGFYGPFFESGLPRGKQKIGKGTLERITVVIVFAKPDRVIEDDD